MVTTDMVDTDPKVERNKETFRLLQEEVIAKGRLELVDRVLSPTFQVRRPGLSRLRIAGPSRDATATSEYEQEIGSNAHEQFTHGYHAMISAFSDQERIIEEINGENNHIWARWRIRATHSGEYLRRPGTGKRVEWVEVAMVHFDDEGRMAEGWFLADEFGLAVQLGIPIG